MASTSQAFLIRGGTPATSCLFTGSTNSGSCISTANTSQYLSSGSGYSVEWTTTDPQEKCFSNSPTCLYVYQTNTPSGSAWYPINGIITVINGKNVVTATGITILCNGDTTPSGNHFYYSVNDLNSSTTWFSVNTNQVYQTVSPCSGNAQYNDFVVNGTTGYGSLNSACGNATASGTIEAKPMPTGMPFWSGSSGASVGPNGCVMTKSGVTITLDSGFKWFGGDCDGGAGGIICVNASNVTISGAGATIGGVNEAVAGNVINMKTGDAFDTIIEGASGNPLVLDCLSQTLAGDDSIESGANVGNTTISHVLVQNCGGGVSGSHSVYLSWGGNVIPASTYSHTVTDLQVVNSGGDTPAVKFDDQCEAAQCSAINLAVYCTTASGECSQNQPYDQQCGGNQLVQNSLLETHGDTFSNQDASYMAKIAWGYLGFGGCAIYPTTGTDATHFDKDIVIYDGTKDIISGAVVIVGCGSGYAHTGCAANQAASTVTSTTSLTIATGFQQLTVPASTSISDGAPVTITNGSNSMLATVVMGYDCTTPAGANFCVKASISGTTLSVTTVDTGPTGEACGVYKGTNVSCTLAPGETLTGTGIPAHTTILSQLTGSSGDSCPAADCNGQVGTYLISNSASVSSEFMGAIGYDSGVGNLLVYVSSISGSGSFSSWTVGYNRHTGFCVTNSEIIGSFNSSDGSINSQMTIGSGVYTDTGCTTSTGTDSNTYYDTASAVTHNGRHDACAVLSQIANSGWINCNTAPNSHGAFPYVPDYTQNPPTQAAQAAEAATLGCSGAGTFASPITGCP